MQVEARQAEWISTKAKKELGPPENNCVEFLITQMAESDSSPKIEIDDCDFALCDLGLESCYYFEH